MSNLDEFFFQFPTIQIQKPVLIKDYSHTEHEEIEFGNSKSEHLPDTVIKSSRIRGKLFIGLIYSPRCQRFSNNYT